ncbi:unnamed protein product, partial [Didymodactylos carnosus]
FSRQLSRNVIKLSDLINLMPNLTCLRLSYVSLTQLINELGNDGIDKKMLKKLTTLTIKGSMENDTFKIKTFCYMFSNIHYLTLEKIMLHNIYILLPLLFRKVINLELLNISLNGDDFDIFDKQHFQQWLKEFIQLNDLNVNVEYNKDNQNMIVWKTN